MNDKKDVEALLRFLDYLKDKGMMKSATAQTRKTTVGKILGVFPPEELTDVTVLDVDDVMLRFHNLEGQNYTTGSLNTYKSRLKATLDDFTAYLENPLGFRPAVQSRASRSKPVQAAKLNEAPKPKAQHSNATAAPTATSIQVSAPVSSNIIPIPIRPNLTVRIHGIPFDLTSAEAKKLAAVIQALAVE